jgi:hypothetical protein
MGPERPIDPSATMQVDAIVEDWDEAPPNVSRPPPLPPKKPSKLALVALVFVVIAAAGLGVAVALFAFGLLDEPTPVAAPRPAPPPEEAPAPSNVVEMDEIVFDVEEEPAQGAAPSP